MKAFILLSFFVACLTAQGQNKLPVITGVNQTTSYRKQACVTITTTDDDNDTVTVWWDKAISGNFSSNNQTVLFATASVCLTATRNVHSVGNNYFTVYASDGKDTVSNIYNFVIRDYPYKVHPAFFNKFNTFTIDVMGDVNEPWGNYIGLTYQSKIYDLDMKLVLTDTHRVFTFTPTVPGKYLLFTTYRTSTPDAYTSRDTLQTDIGTGTFTVENNKLHVYPNPTTGEVYLQNLPPNTAGILLYDITGRKVAEFTGLQPSIQTIGLPNGVYYLQVTDSQGNLLAPQKLVKE